MRALQAVGLTILLMIFLSLPVLLFYLITENWNISVQSNYYQHALLLEAASFLIGYGAIFYWFWKPKIDKGIFSGFLVLDLRILFWIIIMIIGYSRATQPFWDFSKMIDFYKNPDFEFSRNFSYQKDIFYYLYDAMGAVLLAPVFEELFFRQFLLRKLLEKYKPILAIATSSFCFALIHVDNPRNLIPSFFFGIICSLLYLKTRKIRYAIFFHITSNLLVTVFNWFGEDFYNWQDAMQFDFMYWSLSLFGALLVILGIKNIYENEKIDWLNMKNPFQEEET
ncbi:lysostaphin resistance A-like protein [Maribacter sp. 2210JD10-5]|uniref:CPBP family intramembrane glutamic endopeptidase n=1 Tax=Maribacter sp. 2210JD10-5 TaxID=3386272 RepID=UPI0039BD513E